MSSLFKNKAPTTDVDTSPKDATVNPDEISVEVKEESKAHDMPPALSPYAAEADNEADEWAQQGVRSEAYQLPARGKLPSCQELMNNKPTKYGILEKENSSLISKCFNRWKKRYFVLIGGFLFRYTDEHGSSPKGVPIPLDSAQINKSSEAQCFEVVTVRKVYIIKAKSDDEANEWIKAIRDRKALSIAEAMGHRQLSVAISGFNRKATKAFENTVRKESTIIANPMHDTFSAAAGVPSM